MSVTNIISNGEITLVQGVGGFFFCEESWTAQGHKNSFCKNIVNEKTITTEDESIDTDYKTTELSDLP